MPGAATAARQPGGLLLVSVTAGGGRPVGLAGGSQVLMSAKKYAKRVLRFWGSENIPPSPLKRKPQDIPELLPEDLMILKYLIEQPGIAKSQVDVAVGAKIDRTTVGRRLSYLRKIGYVKHPAGKKQRDLITGDGIARLKSISETGKTLQYITISSPH